MIFFLETYSEKQNKYSNNYLDKYIENTIKMYDKMKSIKQKNIRLHYLDIRDILLENIEREFWTILELDIYIRIIEIKQGRGNIASYLEMIDIVYDRFNLISGIFSNIIKNKKYKDEMKQYINKQKNKNIKKFFYTLYKLCYRYNNPIQDFLSIYLQDIIKKIDRFNIIYYEIKSLLTNELFSNTKYHVDKGELSDLNHINSHHYNIISRLVELHRKMTNIMIDIPLLVTDLWFLRRFIDKNYVETAIVYTGAFHSINYLYNLVKYFDFTITHASYLDSTTSIDKLNNLAKQDTIYEFGFPLTNYPIIQCVDMKDFPKDL